MLTILANIKQNPPYSKSESNFISEIINTKIDNIKFIFSPSTSFTFLFEFKYCILLSFLLEIYLLIDFTLK